MSGFQVGDLVEIHADPMKIREELRFINGRQGVVCALNTDANAEFGTYHRVRVGGWVYDVAAFCLWKIPPKPEVGSWEEVREATGWSPRVSEKA